jgi:hypothetical protein
MNILRIMFAFTCICISFAINAQTQDQWWGGYTTKQVVDKADLVFEGRILTDSAFFQRSPGQVYTCHHVLVLKQFKGIFKSDTIKVVTYGGHMIINTMEQGYPPFAKVGDEAVFLVTNSTKVSFGGTDPDTYNPFYGPGVSYVTPCDKKDPITEVYERLEKVIGHSYIDLRPNRCKEWQEEQKKKPKPRFAMGPDGKPVVPGPVANH